MYKCLSKKLSVSEAIPRTRSKFKVQKMQTTRMDVKRSTYQVKLLRDRKVKELVSEKRRLVEVPYTATLAHTMNTLVANQVVAVPVAAPPGHWIGAGGSMIMQSDKHTGAVRKHYIGMVTMLDILAHIAGDDGENDSDVAQRMSVPVSSVIGHCLESLSLWTLNANTSILDCMEMFSKGIHRALVPLDGHVDNVAGVELMESASSYRMLTQMDLMKFLKLHESELKSVMARSVHEMGALVDTIFGITDQTKVIDAIKSMRAGSLNAVPILESSTFGADYQSQLVNGKGRKLIGTFSATDLRGCPISQMQSWLQLNVMEFTTNFLSNTITSSPRELVTCYPESPLSEVVNKVVTKHVHRVWVVDHDGLLTGLVSLTDIIRVIRASLVSDTS